MKAFLFVLSVSLFSVFAQAHNFHSENFCSETDANVCAHIGYNEEFTAEKYYEFVLHSTAPNADKIENLSIELWMDMGNGHGHGSVPVQFSKFGPGLFKVTQVYFIMMGEWQIKVNFDLEGKNHQLIIPVQINK